MNNKIFIFRSLLFAVAVCILLFDMILWLMGQGKQLEHRNALLACLLLWSHLYFIRRTAMTIGRVKFDSIRPLIGI